MTERLASVDKYEDLYIVTTMSRTRDGFWIADGRPERVPATATAEQLGARVRRALDRSRVGVNTPPRDFSPAQPLLDMLDLPNYGAFMRRASGVEVFAEDTSNGQVIEITPQRNAGPREGFQPLEDQTRRIIYGSPRGLGAEVLDAFTRAK